LPLQEVKCARAVQVPTLLATYLISMIVLRGLNGSGTFEGLPW